jgi:hypothetical protein
MTDVVGRGKAPMRAALGWAAVAAALAAAGCRGPMPPDVRGAPWPEANRLFTDDPIWAGGDGAYSVDLGGDRVLWLFGDSFIRRTAGDATNQWMARNSVAVQTGRDPTRAFMRFYWRTEDDHPASFIPEAGQNWFWPGHGVRLGDRLLLFYGRLYQGGEGQWGFRYLDWTAFLVENPDDEPSAWRYREARVAPDEHDVSLAEAVIVEGDKLYVYGNAVNQLRHGVYLVRFELARAAEGDLTGEEWWTGEGWGPRGERAAVLDTGAPELSVHFAEKLGLWMMVQSAGAGATTLGIRTAPRLEGSWSDLRDVLRPPESFYDDAFVYAGKGHPELTGGDLITTYVPSSYDDLPPAIGDAYYHPFFARLTFPEP